MFSSEGAKTMADLNNNGKQGTFTNQIEGKAHAVDNMAHDFNQLFAT